MPGLAWINWNDNDEPVFFRAADGTAYNLDKRSNHWIRAGYNDGMTTKHILEFVKMYNSHKE